MAFQQPIARPVKRATTPPPIRTAFVSPPSQHVAEGSQEWISFPPEPHSQRHARKLSLQPPITGVKSRLSDLGSLGTVSQNSEGGEADFGDDNVTEDLDSLDDGLHAFNEPSELAHPRHMVDQSAQTVLPAHDGLGAFAATSSPVQAQFWQHERYNPRRRQQSLRRSSLQRHFEALEQIEPQKSQDERFERIEKWRVDQSQAIMHEIERESRRLRRRRRLSVTGPPQSQSALPTLDNSSNERLSGQAQKLPSEPDQAEETFLGRFTRRVIKGLLGLDDATLCYIFGEDLPPTDHNPRVPQYENVQATQDNAQPGLELARMSNSWEERLLARIAKELGELVNRISEHPGAFSTYLRVRDMPSYAGLPTLDEPLKSHDQPSLSDRPGDRSGLRHLSKRRHRRHQSSIHTADPSLFGIEEESDEQQVQGNTLSENLIYEQEREYWERDLDVRMVFNYLRNRISTNSHPVRASVGPSNPKSMATAPASSTRPDTLRRAALIRHHHPLVSRNLSPSVSSMPQPSPILGRRSSCMNDDEIASSCASQSTKRSKTHHSGSLSLASSRNYWDIGGSMGSAAGLESGVTWGEV